MVISFVIYIAEHITKMYQHLELSNSSVFMSPESFSDLLQIIMQRLSFHLHKQFYFYNFLKTTRPIATIFGLKDRGNLNYEIVTLTDPTASRVGKICTQKKTKFQKSLLWFPCYDVHNYSPRPNLLVHGPWVRSWNQREKSLWTYSEKGIQSFKVLFLNLHMYMRKNNCMV